MYGDNLKVSLDLKTTLMIVHLDCPNITQNISMEFTLTRQCDETDSRSEWRKVQEFSNVVIPCIMSVVSKLIATLGIKTMLVNQMTEHGAKS